MVGLKLDEPIAKDLEKMVEKKVCEIIPGPAAPPLPPVHSVAQLPLKRFRSCHEHFRMRGVCRVEGCKHAR